MDCDVGSSFSHKQITYEVVWYSRLRHLTLKAVIAVITVVKNPSISIRSCWQFPGQITRTMQITCIEKLVNRLRPSSLDWNESQTGMNLCPHLIGSIENVFERRATGNRR